MTTRKRSAPAPVDVQTLPDVRLAAPSTALAELGIDVGTWKVLTESIFRSPDLAPGSAPPEGGKPPIDTEACVRSARNSRAWLVTSLGF